MERDLDSCRPPGQGRPAHPAPSFGRLPRRVTQLPGAPGAIPSGGARAHRTGRPAWRSRRHPPAQRAGVRGGVLRSRVPGGRHGPAQPALPIPRAVLRRGECGHRHRVDERVRRCLHRLPCPDGVVCPGTVDLGGRDVAHTARVPAPPVGSPARRGGPRRFRRPRRVHPARRRRGVTRDRGVPRCRPCAGRRGHPVHVRDDREPQGMRSDARGRDSRNGRSRQGSLPHPRTRRRVESGAAVPHGQPAMAARFDRSERDVRQRHPLRCRPCDRADQA